MTENSLYTSKEVKLAREFAYTLDDMDSLPMHLKLVRKHSESFLREKLNKVMAIPADQIKKSRAALYMYLISQSDRYGDARH